VYSAIECAPGENGVVVVALAVVVVELAMLVEVDITGAVVVELDATVLVELTAEEVVIGIIDVVVVVFFAAQVEMGDTNQINDINNRKVFFMLLSPLLVAIHGADTRGNVARGIAG
jgi:hypothetical protein